MTRFDEVARLRELEAEATCAPWGLHQMLTRCWQILSDTPEFYIDFEDSDRVDPELITCLRNAAPWLLGAAACFHHGDVRCLKAIMGIMRAATGPETDSDELDCLRRLQKAAEIMEELE
jgi:hypothetical protein